MEVTIGMILFQNAASKSIEMVWLSKTPSLLDCGWLCTPQSVIHCHMHGGPVYLGDVVLWTNRFEVFCNSESHNSWGTSAGILVSVEEGCLICKGVTFGLGIGMFGGDGLSRTVSFKFYRADDLQNRTRTDEIRNRHEKEYLYYLHKDLFFPKHYIKEKKMDWNTKWT